MGQSSAFLRPMIRRAAPVAMSCPRSSPYERLGFLRSVELIDHDQRCAAALVHALAVLEALHQLSDQRVGGLGLHAHPPRDGCHDFPH